LLGLRKPDPTDNVNVTTDISDNMELIDDYFAGRFAVTPGRNAIRNGDMGVAQRGDGAYTGNQYGVDGWRYLANGGAPVATRVAAGIGAGFGVDGARYALQAAISGQAAAGDLVDFAQAIEDVRTLAGKQVTLSFSALATAGTPKIGIEIEQNFGTGGAPSATVLTAIQAVTISTVATRYSVTFTVPNINGKTLGTGGNDFLAVHLWLSAGSTNAARASNIGIQNSTFQITDVQLEVGSVATAFERLPQQVQLAWCQRYFERINLNGQDDMFAAGLVFNTTAAIGFLKWTQTMRAAPSVTFTGGFEVVGSTIITASGVGASNVTVHGAQLDMTITGGTAGQGAVFRSSTSGTNNISISAEL
ncbi:MAG TPA: hypothetical protein VFK94_05860, partial [Patescibacteria group bacterium]|nr:hypothetical protein [Patescibacteria group bacterium]